MYVLYFHLRVPKTLVIVCRMYCVSLSWTVFGNRSWEANEGQELIRRTSCGIIRLFFTPDDFEKRWCHYLDIHNASVLVVSGPPILTVNTCNYARVGGFGQMCGGKLFVPKAITIRLWLHSLKCSSHCEHSLGGSLPASDRR